MKINEIKGIWAINLELNSKMNFYQILILFP